MTRKRKARTTAILYARFSPRPHAAECESVESQLADLGEYCRKRGYEVAGEYSDKALSGGDDWEDRPGMFDAAQSAKRGMLFIVRAFDRLFRDTRKGLIFAAMLERKGVKIRSITEEAASLDTPEAKLMRTIFLSVAEYQRHIIRARTRAKMLDHQKNGRRMSKVPPYGKMIDPENPERLAPSIEEIAAIALIKKLYLEGARFREIARELDARGIRSRGPRWNHNIVGKILRREGLIVDPVDAA